MASTPNSAGFIFQKRLFADGSVYEGEWKAGIIYLYYQFYLFYSLITIF